jgi:glycosyltransferase involved in cell wall biosynthesis
MVAPGTGTRARSADRRGRKPDEEVKSMSAKKVSGSPDGGLSAELHVDLIRLLPTEIEIGAGQTLYVMGWVWHPRATVSRVDLVADGLPEPVPARLVGRSGHLTTPTGIDTRPPLFDSAFVGLVPVTAEFPHSTLVLHVRVRLRDGTIAQKKLGNIALIRDPVRLSAEAEAPAGASGPLVAVCMASYNPPLDLFKRQIDSLRRQTHGHWVCVISDDGTLPADLQRMRRVLGDDRRFHLSPSPGHLGFYRNFERALRLAPPGAEFIALCDQDDRWHPGKLEALLAEFSDPRTQLAYSDMRIVDRSGQEVAGSFWGERRNAWTNLGSLLLANTVTGAASMFRASLLEKILPFPISVSHNDYHDHWIATVALASGAIRFLPRPLHDYVQHGGNVIGYCGKPAPRPPLRQRIVSKWRKVRAFKAAVKEWHWRQRMIYYADSIRIRQCAQVVQMRCGDTLRGAKLRAVRRLAHQESLAGLAWLLARGIVRWRGGETLGAEWYILNPAIWSRLIHPATRLARWLRRARRPVPVAVTPAEAEAPAAPPHSPALDMTGFIEARIAPLRLFPDGAEPVRINLLIPSIDFRYFFGGYITKFNFARKLAEAGNRVRIVTVDLHDFQIELWRKQLRAYPNLEVLFDVVEVVNCSDRSRALPVNPNDCFVATTWWTGHVAEAAVRELNQRRFIYLIQEYEPFTFPMGTFAALAEQSYAFPHAALFSTDLLREFFEINRLGVYAPHVAPADRLLIPFQNTITDVGRVHAKKLAARAKRKLLFYARPEGHAARNMFEMGMLALARAVRDGSFGPEWEFFGIGTNDLGKSMSLPEGRVLHLLPRTDQRRYQDVLRDHDVGLALMYTPHPSLVPIEMASAGMLTVTNSCLNKTPQRLWQISENFVPVAPGIVSIAEGLREAVENVGDIERRVRGAMVNWSRSWDDTFDAAFMARLREMIGACRAAWPPPAYRQAA